MCCGDKCAWNAGPYGSGVGIGVVGIVVVGTAVVGTAVVGIGVVGILVVCIGGVGISGVGICGVGIGIGCVGIGVVGIGGVGAAGKTKCKHSPHLQSCVFLSCPNSLFLTSCSLKYLDANTSPLFSLMGVTKSKGSLRFRAAYLRFTVEQKEWSQKGG